MIRSVTILFIVFFSLGGTAVAKGQVPIRVKTELDKLYSSYSVESSGSGDFNKDGIADYAAIIRLSDKSMRTEVVVFWGKQDESYELFTKSRKLCSNQLIPELYSENDSLFVSALYKSPGMDSGETYQFKLIDGKLLLIGVESYSRADNTVTEIFEYKSKRNLVTGEERENTVENNKIVEKITKHKINKLVNLRDFELWTQ
jgi:hypothetical protein